jgi:cytochrome c'
VPLPPMMIAHQREQMRQHLESVQGIIAGLAAEDFDAVAAAADGIGPSPAMAAQCKHMGGGVAGFTEAALHFHETAGEIGAAAKRRDRAGVTAALGATLKECTACHATYRQVVSGS